MTRKTKSPVDLIADLLASVQESEKKYVIELRSFAHALADANDGMAGMKCENDKLRAENTKLRKKLARVTASATAAHRELQMIADGFNRGVYVRLDGLPIADPVASPGVMPCGDVPQPEEVKIMHGVEFVRDPDDPTGQAWCCRETLRVRRATDEAIRAARVSVQDGVEVHGNLGGVDPNIALACATGAVSWPSATGAVAWPSEAEVTAMLNATLPPSMVDAWAGMAAFGDNT